MPAESEKQRRFMGAELARKRAGKATKTEMTEEQLEDFASKSAVEKLWTGARQEGPKPQMPDHLLPRKKGHGSAYPPNRNGALGPHRELKKEQAALEKAQQKGGGKGAEHNPYIDLEKVEVNGWKMKYH